MWAIACCSVSSALVWFWPDRQHVRRCRQRLARRRLNDDDRPDGRLRVGAARSQRNLPAPSQLARPANAQPRIRVPTAALGRAMRPNVSYDCNHSFRQKVRPSWRAQWPVPARRADQGRDCGAAEIQCIAEDAPRWPNIKYVERGLGSAALLNMAVEPLAMCYPALAGGTLRGRPPPRFRTIQVCPVVPPVVPQFEF